MIDAGVYNAVNKKHYFIKMTGTDGKPFEQFCAEFEIQAGKFAGQSITWRGGFKGKGFEYTTKAMEAMGWDKKTLPSQCKLDKEVKIVVEHEENKKDGKMYAVVKYVNSLEGGGGGFRKYEMDATEGTTFEQNFMALHRQQMMAQGENVESGSLEGGGGNKDKGEKDDDLPF